MKKRADICVVSFWFIEVAAIHTLRVGFEALHLYKTVQCLEPQIDKIFNTNVRFGCKSWKMEIYNLTSYIFRFLVLIVVLEPSVAISIPSSVVWLWKINFHNWIYWDLSFGFFFFFFKSSICLITDLLS